MARVAAWVGGSLMAAAATVATVGFVEGAASNDAPTTSECMEAWNGRLGEREQRLVTAEGYRSATVHGWFHDYPGCGIGFTAPGAHPFLVLTCARGFSASDPAGTDWGCEWETPSPDPSGSAGPAEVADVVSGWQLSLR